MTAAVDAGTALRRALDQQLQQANSQAMKQEAEIKVGSVACWTPIGGVNHHAQRLGSSMAACCAVAAAWYTYSAGARLEVHISATQDLQNDLADRCEELRAAQRKLVMARTSSNAAAMETAGPQPPPATPAKETKRQVHTPRPSAAACTPQRFSVS